MAGSLALGLRIATNMKGRVLALREIERILSYLEGELRYRHSMLSEALCNVAAKSGHPFRQWLYELSSGIEAQSIENQNIESIDDGEFRDFYSMWVESLQLLRDKTLLSSQDIDSLLDVGKALGYLDIESQLMNLNLEMELIHKHILELDKDISSRMKNAIVMCFLGGIMTVIALL